MNHFENFQGFKPEGEFDSSFSGEPCKVAIFILKSIESNSSARVSYINQHVDHWHFHSYAIPLGDENIISIIGEALEKDKPDRIEISTDDLEIPTYTIQKIVIGDQAITEIDKKIKNPSK